MPDSNYIQTHVFRSKSTSLPFMFEEMKTVPDYDTNEIHRHNYYEIFLFEKGGGKHTIDFVELPVKDRSLHFITPGQVHHLERKKGSFGSVMMFTDEFFYFNAQNKDLLFNLPFFHIKTDDPTFTPGKAEYDELKKLCGEIAGIYKSDHPFKLSMLQSYLHIFLLRSKIAYAEARDSGESVNNPSRDLVYNFRQLVEQNFSDQHLVNSYAKKLNTTPAKLNTASKTITGKSASEIIKERILLEAKRLLLFSGMNAKQIAFELNFEDPSHFNRFFKSHTGYSPQEFVKAESQKHQYDLNE